jgi:hypothetical protein
MQEGELYLDLNESIQPGEERLIRKKVSQNVYISAVAPTENLKTGDIWIETQPEDEE